MRPLPLSLRRCRTPDGWDFSVKSHPDEWAGLTFSLLVPAILQPIYGIPETSRPGTPPPPWSRFRWMWYRCANSPGTAMYMNQSFPTKHYGSFLSIRRCFAGMSTRVRSSQSLCSGRATVLASVSIVRPRTSLKQVQ